jgi:acetyltransferase-like isoleucine patch superfamily enzyme
VVSGATEVGHAELAADVRIGPFCVLGQDPDGLDEPLVVGAGAVLRSHSVLYRGTTIGARFQCGHGVLIREHTRIGDDVSVGSHSVVEHHVELGDGARLHSRCFVPEHTVIGPGAWLGPGVTVTNARYPNRPDTKANLEGVTIEEGAVVGAAVVLLPGVTIGAGALVGAGAVVVADIPAGATVVGNPGRLL